MASNRILSYKGLDLDTSAYHLKPEFARFLKNLVYVFTDSSQVTNNQSGAAGVFKPYESNGKFDISFVLPAGKNQCIGYLVVRETGQVVFLNWNGNSDFGVYVIDAATQTIQRIYQNSCLHLQRKPQFFLHEGGGALELFEFTDPNTGLPRKRSYFMYTDGSDYQKFIS